MINFNQHSAVGKEAEYVQDVIQSGLISANYKYTKLVHQFFAEKYGFTNCFLTSSCTDALEMAAILCDINPGDEVIMPSYTFVSTANAFALRGAKIRFADTEADSPQIDQVATEALITDKTKAIVVVHYAGVPCDISAFVKLAKKHNLMLVEDAAHAIDSFFENQALGTFGDLATFSFHETKNISCGEGGLLVVNNHDLVARADVIWQKGTNRSDFKRKIVSKYSWVDLGSSFQASDLTAAYLYGQLEQIKKIQDRRVAIWKKYYSAISCKNKKFSLSANQEPYNAHLFYLMLDNFDVRAEMIRHLNDQNIMAIFHYIPLHSSPYFLTKHDSRSLPNTDKFANRLLRLPLYYSLTEDQQDQIIEAVNNF